MLDIISYIPNQKEAVTLSYIQQLTNSVTLILYLLKS